MMINVQVFHYDAFSNTPNKGNPAGVVLEADHLTVEDMQEIAKRVGFNETVFVTSSDKAGLRLKYFTPGHEIPLCGHATMAALYALKSRGLLNGSHSLMIETNIGVLPIQFRSEQGIHIRMKQGSPQFIPFTGSVDRLFQAMGLAADAWDEAYPIVYGSTGTWTLLIPIKELASFKQMKPQNNLFPDILVENPKASIHPFSFSAYGKNADMHARHFSSPYSGTIEDPVTGTASGAMGGYYITYVKPELDTVSLLVEQGQEMGRDGAVHVEAIRHAANHIDVFISGTAVYVGEIDGRIFT